MMFKSLGHFQYQCVHGFLNYNNDEKNVKKYRDVYSTNDFRILL